MKLIDWSLKSSKRGKFTLEFETTKWDEYEIRMKVNEAILDVQLALAMEEKYP